MTDLESFGAHAARMAKAAHKLECRGHAGADRPAPPACPGCVTPAQRMLWAALAQEVADYLTPAPAEETLL